jgi:hypothetical protein
MTTALSTQTQPRGLALQTMGEAMAFAQMVAKSDFAPKDFKGKAESCLLAIQHGSEVGLSPMQSLQSIAVINGRPAVWGDAALAVVSASPVCEFVTEGIEGEGEQMVATCIAKRRGYPAPTAVRFSVADAKKAGLWGKTGPWTQYPKRMLQLRARGFALRDAFPDVLKGLVTAEEAQDYQHAEPVMIRSQGETSRPLTNTVKDSGNGITVAHVERFEPPQETPVGKAKIAVSKCASIDAADKLRNLMAQRLADGVFSQAEHDELVQLLHHKVEMLIGDDAGQEFTHEAAEHEVTA